MTASIRRVALTGGIASGKSLVGDHLRAQGIPVIDADDVVHQLLREDIELKDAIRQEFGDEVFDANGQVIRPQLGAMVFQSVPRRKLLESWIHPKTRQKIDAFYQENHQATLGVSIIPLLFESNLEGLYDEVWLLDTDEATQLARLLEKRGMTEADALARIRNQMPMSQKRERARQCPCHFIFQNTGSSRELLQSIDARLQSLYQS